MRIALLTTSLLCLALAACDGPRGTWAKQGGAPYQSLSTQKQCLEKANKLSFLDIGSGPRIGGSAIGGADAGYARNARNDMFRLCMADQGYSKVRDVEEEEK